MAEGTNTLNHNQKVDWKNRIIWILLVTIFWYVLVLSTLEAVLFDGGISPFSHIEMSSAMRFTVTGYLSTIVPFLGILIYTLITKRNRFIFRSFMPMAAGNHLSALLWGLLVGFVMNFGCIVWALLAGNIKLFYNFALDQIPFFFFALVCVFIQSTSEELWCRGFMYERINVHYPLWVAILVNGLFFASLHTMNPGADVLPIVDIAICGLSFSIAKWYTGSIWFPMGIHTAWNFTQNLLFGLPNSGLVSRVSVFRLEAASASDPLIYDPEFGVEGSLPATIVNLALTALFLYYAYKEGRLRELALSYEKIQAADQETDAPVGEEGV